MKSALIVLLLFAPFAAPAAQPVHKCVDADGAVVYQSGDCAPGQTASRSWTTQPPATTPNDLRARKSRERANSAYLRKLARRHRRPSGTGAAISSHRDVRKCDAARARRAKAEQASHRLTLAQLERLGDDVYEACK